MVGGRTLRSSKNSGPKDRLRRTHWQHPFVFPQKELLGICEMIWTLVNKSIRQFYRVTKMVPRACLVLMLQQVSQEDIAFYRLLTDEPFISQGTRYCYRKQRALFLICTFLHDTLARRRCVAVVSFRSYSQSPVRRLQPCVTLSTLQFRQCR